MENHSTFIVSPLISGNQLTNPPNKAKTWRGHQTYHKVTLQKVYYLPALFMGCGVVESYLAIA